LPISQPNRGGWWFADSRWLGERLGWPLDGWDPVLGDGTLGWRETYLGRNRGLGLDKEGGRGRHLAW
jgi:hypothetical protein